MPRAESEADRRNQIEIADCVLKANARRFDGYIWLSEMLYRVDGCFFQKEAHRFNQAPRLFFEAKQRNYPFGHYRDGYHVSVGKIIAARWLRDTTGLPVALFARFSDGVVAGADLIKHSGEFLIGGRPLRSGFPHDIEPMAKIDWGKFKVIHDPRG